VPATIADNFRNVTPGLYLSLEREWGYILTFTIKYAIILNRIKKASGEAFQTRGN
jgi:hypothetical protein